MKKKIFFLAIFILVLAIFLAGCAKTASHINDVNITEKTGLTPLIIVIYDKSCISCSNPYNDSKSVLSTITNEIPEMKIIIYEKDSSEGKSFKEKFGITFYPFYLYNDEAKKLMENSRLFTKGFSKQEKDGYYLDLNIDGLENRKLSSIPAAEYFDINYTQKKITLIRYDQFGGGNRTFNNESLDGAIYTFQIIVPLNPQSFREGIYEPLYCAKRQGKYEELANEVVKYEFSLNESNLKKIAMDLGINSEQFVACCKSQEIKQEIQTIGEEVQAAGINGLPTQIINSELVMNQGFSEAIKHYNAIQ